LELKTIRDFFIIKGLFDIHGIVNIKVNKKWESTYCYGSKCINTIAAIAGIINYVDGCTIIECNELIITNHREYLVDVNLERYFDSNEFEIDKNDSSKLDSRWAIYKLKFIEIVEKYIDQYDVSGIMDKYCNESASKDQLEVIDNKIIYFFK